MYPAQILVVEDEGIVADCMQECFVGRNSYRWPQLRDNKTLFPFSDVLCKIAPPIVQPNNRRSAMSLLDEDFEKARDMLS